MKLAISNIAWAHDEDEAIRGLMPKYGAAGVEIAPTKIWPDPTAADPAMLDEYRRFWEGSGISIPSMQALLFGHPELRIFESPANRLETLTYLERIMRVGAGLGAQALVFGSPKNRLKGDLSLDAAMAIAGEFFLKAAAIAERVGVIVCIEPNPPQYGCDFIHTVAEGARLVRAVNRPGFRLHLDGSSIILNGEDPDGAIREAADCMAHFHISAPNLEALGGNRQAHAQMARALRAIGWSGWASIEMRSQPDGVPNAPSVELALAFAREVYFH